jgi:pimeloyl-ACP methyl ester carboxylesterase
MPSPTPVPSSKNSTNVRAPQGALRFVQGAMRGVQAVAPPLAPALAEVLFRTPRRFPTPNRERQWLTGAEQLAVPYDGELLRAWSWGSGPAVVLAHGWEGRGSQMGALGVALAAAGFRAVAFDAPAHGASRRRLASLPQFTGALSAVAAAVGPVHALVGHSFGGAAACWGLARGLRTERLVLLASPADLDSYVSHFGKVVGARRATLDGLVQRLEARFLFDWQEGRRPALAAAKRVPETPVLIVHDDEDDETPWQDGAAVAALWPRGRFVTTHGLGHRRLLHAPEVTREVVSYLSAALDLPREVPRSAALA